MQPNEQPSGNWTYNPEGNSQTASAASQPVPAQSQPSQPVTWTASEFIDHHKDPAWYFLLMGGVTALCGVLYFFTRDVISVVSIAVVVILYLVLSNAKPKQRAYSVDGQGIAVDNKHYPYGMFKSFAVSQEGAIGCVTFIPLKRFMPELSIYFPPDAAQGIIDVLAASLPNDQRPEHGLDRLVKRLHL